MKEKSSIALVDDERNILTSLGMALEAEGYKVRTYSDGASALEALTEEPVDLAILDIKMPRMDGMELLRRLRQLTDMPVIFLTSKDEEIDELFGLKMGADDYIAKPFSQRLVVERVKAVLRRFQPKEPGSAAAEAARVLERGKGAMLVRRQRPSHLLDKRAVNIDRDYDSAGFRKRLGGSGADPLARTRDYGHLILQHHDRRLLLGFVAMLPSRVSAIASRDHSG